jgi:tetratricopeptide (TPR) repeat protein
LESHQAARLRRFALACLPQDPHSPVAYKDLGAAALALNEANEAVAAYTQALRELPAFLALTDPHHPPGLTSQEADLLNLLSVSARLAGDAATADTACERISTRQPKAAHLDRLCQAYAAEASHHTERARALLQSYQAPAPEHDALVTRLQAALDKAPRTTTH